MTTSTSRLAFTDCEDVFARAMDQEIGLRVMFPDAGKARHFIGRMHRFRELDRKANLDNFEKGHPLHGRSTYDQLVCRSPYPETFADGSTGWWVDIEKMTIDNLTIEPLVRKKELPIYEEPKMIEHKDAAE